MLLTLLRHAEASPQAGKFEDDDFSRRLTEKGIEQANRVGEFLAKLQMKPDLILTSPVLRAKETAKIVTTKIEKLGKVELLPAPWIACGMTPDTALDELSSYARFDSVMIVGHEPDFSTLIASLIGMKSGENINVTKASLTAIDISRFAFGCGVLRFLIPVKLL